ncbi:RDD family protein [Spelaeicoccus albus]|uniref:Putative RDD family membrane protein YckC n=1 Tax=Spelaeicoccus albus TaxID=1280376 RepID=A0A7Z0D326_9MICO|nr:RDD family protein [Spelaeicoccus albus]NYI67952.1 putative RDD family membrane protein YckC [Spelaeicoccus albus]
MIGAGTVTTGEAVELEIEPASVGMRALSCLIDFVVVVLAYYLLIIVALTGLLASVTPSKSLMTALMLIFYVLILVAFPIMLETFTRGKSIGKYIVGLRIVRDDGGAVRFRHALIRALLWQFEVLALTGALAALVGLLSPKGKRIGDYLAGTYATRDRATRVRTRLTGLPPRMAGWASVADMRSLPDPLARRVAQFLSHAATMTPASRGRMAADLAAEAGPYVAPLPPPGVGAEEFLAGVMAERRRRDLDRLERQSAQLARHNEALHKLPFGLDDVDPEQR